jgi:hypothetical protein
MPTFRSFLSIYLVFLSPCSGASIRACRSLNRHVVALEPELELYEEVLLPLIPASEEVDSESRRDPSPTQHKKRSTHFDDEEVEKKSAPSVFCEDDVWSFRKEASMDLLQICELHFPLPLQRWTHSCMLQVTAITR